MTSNVGAKIIEKESGIQTRKSNDFDINSDLLSVASDPVLDPALFKRISFLVNHCRKLASCSDLTGLTQTMFYLR